MSPRTLAGLVAIAEHGQLARAASELRVTPRALSRSLKELERETGEPLIAGSELTPSGHRIARSARPVLDALRRFEAAARADSTTLRVAHVAHSGTLSTLLDRIALQFEERVMTDSEQLAAVAEHRLDVAVCCVADLPDGLESRVLRHDPLVEIGAGQDRVVASYGAAWPAFDACAASVAGERVPVVAGTGALLRLRRPVVVAGSVLDDTPHRGREVAPGLTWHIVWRSGNTSPMVLSFVEQAMQVAEELGWRK